MTITGAGRMSGTNGLLRLIRRRRFPIAILSVSVALHGWALCVVFLPAARGLEVYALEFAAAVLLAAVLDLVANSTRKVLVFRAVYLLRVGLIVIALNLLGIRSVTISLFLTIPLILEIVFYDAGFPRFVLVVCVLLALSVTVSASLLASFDTEAIVFLGSYAIGTALITAAVFLLDEYREAIVERTATIESLQTTVGNLADANKAFQSYADNLENESAEKERNRITSELHDAVGYALTNVIVMMKAGKILLKDDPAALASVLDRVGEQSEYTLAEVRQTLHKMQAAQSPEPKGLNAIYGLTRAFEGATRIRVDVNRGNYPMSIGQRLDRVVFRVVQESLTNAFRHGHATVIAVFFWRSSEDVSVCVRDNGSGASSTNHEEGIGLRGMRERLAEFDGTLATRHTDAGFELEVRIPYKIGGLDGTNQSSDRR